MLLVQNYWYVENVVYSQFTWYHIIICDKIKRFRVFSDKSMTCIVFTRKVHV